jgi:F0F1-type ATP synthase membrane subunit b/b'
MSNAETGPSITSAPAGDLAQLVAAEQQIEQRLARARMEAAALIEAATREAEHLAETWQKESEATQLRTVASLEREQGAREAQVLAEGRARAAWYDERPDSVVAKLAGVVLDRLLSEEYE